MIRPNFFIILGLLIFITGSLAQDREFKFSVPKAREYWHYCIAAGCNPTRIPKWNLGNISQTYPGMTDIRLVSNETVNAFAYLSYQANENIIYVVFRGTQFTSLKNWMENSKYEKVPYEYCNCKVHQGFLDIYNTLRRSLTENLAEMKRIHRDAKIRLLGHSLGGALATLAAFEIWSMYGDFDAFMTFGSPRVGDEAFATWWNGIFANIDTARVTHARDPVPHLALESWEYQHVNTEVFFPNDDGNTYQICEKNLEDPQCSLQYSLAVDVLDHLTYMGVFSVGLHSQCK